MYPTLRYGIRLLSHFYVMAHLCYPTFMLWHTSGIPYVTKIAWAINYPEMA